MVYGFAKTSFRFSGRTSGYPRKRQNGRDFTHSSIAKHFQLTANRGSVENTSSEILDDLRKAIKDSYDDIEESDDWQRLRQLDKAASARRTSQKEEKNFKRRQRQINRANIAQYNEEITLIEPQRESGVFALFLQLSTLNPNLFRLRF